MCGDRNHAKIVNNNCLQLVPKWLVMRSFRVRFDKIFLLMMGNNVISCFYHQIVLVCIYFSFDSVKGHELKTCSSIDKQKSMPEYY